MKTSLLVIPVIALCGCARFATTQTDTSYGTDGKPQRSITTHASTTTFFDSSSKLASFKASQTDKTQAASVGSIDQSASSTNFTSQLESVAKIIQALPK